MPMNQAICLTSLVRKAGNSPASRREPRQSWDSSESLMSRSLYILDANPGQPKSRKPALYSSAERKRRDESPWTLVQGVLAPVQFGVFLVSLALVLRYLATGEGYGAATISIVVK